ncbi:AAA family ATPase [Bacillus cereus]|uniref:AAA family ATPase n=1 Tax=Bacillus cereus TaxID=1396 RepID=UPI003872C429
MNINKLVIKNFKNYTGEHIFDLNKRITIIFGNNGFGKSSFFDAIEWCMTGRLNRFNKREFKPRDVLTFNNYGRDKECKVQIFFSGYKLERSFNYRNEKLSNMKVKLTQEDGTIINSQSGIDEFLRNNYFRTNKEDNEIFGSLITHSHLLSQDQVTDFVVKDNPKDRFNSLAEILGLKNVLFTFENYTQIKKTVNKRIENLEAQKLIINNQLKERRGDLTTIDQKKVYLYLKDLGMKSTFKEVFENITQLKEVKESQIFHNKRQKQSYQSYLDLGYTNIDEITKQLEELQHKIKSIEIEIREKTQLKGKVNSLGNSLQEEKHRFVELNELNEQIKKMKLENKETQYVNLSIDEIKNMLNAEDQEVGIIDFSRSYQNSHNKMNEFIESAPLNINKLDNKLHVLSRRIERLNALLTAIDQRISKQDNGITVKLVGHLREILKYVEENDEDNNGKCPVCSTEHGDRLPNLINTNISQHKEILKEDTLYAEKFLAMKRRVIQKKDLVMSLREDIQNEISNIKQKQTSYKVQLEKIKSNSMFRAAYIEKLTDQELEDLKGECINRISILNKNLSNKLEIEKLSNKVNILKKILGTKHVAEDLEIRKKRLERAEKRIHNHLISRGDEKESLEKEYKRIYQEYPFIEGKKKYGTLQLEIDNLESLNLEIEKDLDKISELLELQQVLDLNKKIGVDIRRYYQERSDIAQNILKHREIEKSINYFMNSMESVIGNETTSFLNARDSLIQKYYRYLNPMSNSKGVQFKLDGKGLNICIPIQDEKNQEVLFNAKHTLSSGQLNVLAISIFLAINESQKVSKLDFIGIDDPIQNMDDVNRFSICDVLNSLEKQVIISTHDMEFVKLFVKKNQHRTEQIQAYMLESPLLEVDRVKHITF